MSKTRQTILASRPAAMVLALSLVAGLSAPFVMLPTVHAAAIVPNGTTELSPAPVDQTKAVPPNIVVTFDDSGSMRWDYLGDDPPFGTGKSWSSGPWYCAGVIDPGATSGIDAHVMNGVYFNPNINYDPPVKADGGSFKDADDTLKAVQDDGVSANRPLSKSGGSNTTNFTLTNIPKTGWYWNGSGGTSGYKNSSNWAWGAFPTGTGWYSNNSHYDGYGHPNPPNKSSERKYGQYPDQRWTCPYDHNSPIAGGGPYYYKYTGPTITVDKYGNPDSTGLSNLYDKNNWTAVAVPASQYQNWANWWSYYHTRNLMARTSLSRVFGATSLSATTSTGGYGNDIRVAWQNLYDGVYGINDKFVLQSDTIISALIDQNPANCNQGGTPPTLGSQSLFATTAPKRDLPDCYRSDFFNWIYQVPAQSGTPLRSALKRAGDFFMRGYDSATGIGDTGATGDLHDPYWQPPQHGTFNKTSNPGNELYCRQNYSILITDGLWNAGADGPQYSILTLPTAGTALPDGVTPPSPTVAGVTSIYSPVHDGGNTYYSSLSDVAYHYWATNLRPDLYLGGVTAPKPGDIVSPYLPDTYTGLFGAGDVSGGYGDAKNIPAEEYFNPKNDPATWPHMSDYMIGLGVNGTMNFSDNTDCKSAVAADLDACDLRKGVTNSTGSIGWPTPDGNGNGIAANIDDTWHAALAGRGQFFSAANPTQLVTQLTSVLNNISARNSPKSAGSTNASVVTAGALSFNTGYTSKWSGVLQAVVLNADGTIGATKWDAASELDAATPSGRKIYTDAYSSTGSFSSFEFTTANSGSLDATETAGLLTPAIPTGSTTDTLGNRIDYLRGDKTHEADGTYRSRTDILGAIVHSQPVYVSYPASNYYNVWPSTSPEAIAAAASNGTDDKSYDSFVVDHADRPGTVYVGANDGMLHAFAAPAPSCTSAGVCTYTGGTESWAFVPRAIYANLGNLTSVSDFKYRPTVDATPVTRDVFFGETGASNTDNKWHTMLVGGVGLGGRGVYALDITGNSPPNVAVAATKPNAVMWEFDADMSSLATGCTAISGSSVDPIGCRSSDLGFTVSQPNIGRLANNDAWVVLMPNGYFPDCSKPDIPTDPSLLATNPNSCAAISAQAPKYGDGHPYSALFVLDAQTGKMIAELKTPDLSGVYSYGLATPVMGDYDNDQVDDVAFAGDLSGNLWRFDLEGAPSSWTVTLVYKGISDSGGNQGLQPITTMPRLFPDPATNRFMVVFGTGKYLGADDNGTTQVQAVYGIRDPGNSATSADAYSIANGDLVQQYLSESVEPATLPGPTGGSTIPNPLAGVTVRCITGTSSGSCSSGSSNPPNAVPATKGGWYFNLKTTSGGVQTDQGEQVVVTPGAIFASNTAVISTLLTGASGNDPCNPATQGAVMFINAIDGGPGTGVSSLGGYPAVGARVNNARTSGSLPVVSALGGGQVFIPGMTLTGSSKKTPITGDLPVWRRRSWSEINQN